MTVEPTQFFFGLVIRSYELFLWDSVKQSHLKQDEKHNHSSAPEHQEQFHVRIEINEASTCT
eukprot:m.603 g.603  ORF g.603 m.603 type:complete len:62 (-) comp222_c1_seq1:503-688(-)